MSDEQPSATGAPEDENSASRPQAVLVEERVVRDPDNNHDNHLRVQNRPLGLEHIRHVVRVFQCRRCSKPLRDPVTLPCGQTLCKTCIPETHIRECITYPSNPERQEGFTCPFNGCLKVHALSDCSFDIILNKICRLMEEEIDRARLDASKLDMQTRIQFFNPWDVAGIPSLHNNELESHVIQGGRLVSTWSLALDGGLPIETEVIYTDSFSSTPDGSNNELKSTLDIRSLARLQTATRQEMDCHVCYTLIHDPLTTECGHTFCRPCLHRNFDHSNRCPVCRRLLTIHPSLNPQLCPSNESLIRIAEHFWPQEKLAREKAVAADFEASHGDLDVPLFVCTLSFPSMPTFLHVFEPRYRLMMRRALEGNKTFGMVLPKQSPVPDDRHFHQLGTLLRITNAQFYPDGRSLIETVGITRFRVVRFGELDGYTVAKTERIDDMSLEEEEAIEAAEAAPGFDRFERYHSPSSSEATHISPFSPFSPPTERGPQTPQPPSITALEFQFMSTRALMKFATDFVARVHFQSVPWLTTRMLAIYGNCPIDPAIFPWWFASMLPVKDLEKYRLLATSSVRERLKICCKWILEWESKTW